MTKQQPALDPDERLTPQQVADEFGVSRGWVWDLCEHGRLSHIKRGRRTLIRRRVAAAMFAREVPARTE